jgi:hypothetical protein
VDPQGQSPSPLTAQCQVHAGQPFTAVCQRCGTYMCSVCSEGGRHALCAPCRERAGVGEFPFRRDAYTLGALLSFSWNAYKESWGVLTGATAIFMIIVIAISVPFTIAGMLLGDQSGAGIALQVVSFVVQSLVQGFLSLGLFLMSLKAARGVKPELGDLFGATRRFGTWVAQALIIGAMTTPVIALLGGGFWLLGSERWMISAGLGVLLFPVAIYVFMGFAFGAMEIIAQPGVTAMSALRNSWAIVSGKRLELLFLAIGAFVIYVAGLVACFVGILFTMSYASVVFAAYYLAVRNGASGLSS